MIEWSRPRSGTPHVLTVHSGNVELLWFLRLMRMIGARIDPQISELHAAKRSARQHALDSLFNDAFGEAPFHDRLGSALFDPTDEAGVIVIDLLLLLTTGEHRLCGVDETDVCAALDVRGVGCLVLAA